MVENEETCHWKDGDLKTTIDYVNRMMSTLASARGAALQVAELLNSPAFYRVVADLMAVQNEAERLIIIDRRGKPFAKDNLAYADIGENEDAKTPN